MEIDRVGGLPAHPLLVHIPVIMIPLLAILAIALVFKPVWRDWLGVWVPLAWAGMFVAIILVKGSGEKLESHIGGSPLIEKHSHLADQLTIIWIVFVVIIVAQYLVDRLRRKAGDDASKRPSWLGSATTALSVLVVAGSIVSTVWVVKVGHAGAKSAWGDTPTGTAKEGDGG